MFLGLSLPPSSGVHVMSTGLHVVHVFKPGMCENSFLRRVLSSGL
jgi:hypothetical protein